MKGLYDPSLSIPSNRYFLEQITGCKLQHGKWKRNELLSRLKETEENRKYKRRKTKKKKLNLYSVSNNTIFIYEYLYIVVRVEVQWRQHNFVFSMYTICAEK
jgi:hypothetical protein